MIPFDSMPGAGQWAKGLHLLVAHDGPLWVWGPYGSGASTVAQWLASQRSSGVFEHDSAEGLHNWLAINPKGVVASEKPVAPENNEKFNFLELRLWTFDDDPPAIQKCLEHIAQEEGIDPPFPPALSRLPCRGNLRELRNRLRRWKSLGQVPEQDMTLPDAELFETEDMASNIHILERVLLHRALKRSYGNRVEAAKRLGISRRQVYLLIGRHGDPIRGKIPVDAPPKRLAKIRHNSDSGNDRQC